MAESPEMVLLRTVGGPHPGDRIAAVADWDWPLPATLPDTGGHYEKVSESALPPQERYSGLMRGARYEWRPDDG